MGRLDKTSTQMPESHRGTQNGPTWLWEAFPTPMTRIDMEHDIGLGEASQKMFSSRQNLFLREQLVELLRNGAG